MFFVNFGKPRNLCTTKNLNFKLPLTYSYYHVPVQSKTAPVQLCHALALCPIIIYTANSGNRGVRAEGLQEERAKQEAIS